VHLSPIFCHVLVFFLILPAAGAGAPLSTNVDLIVATLEQAVDEALAEMDIPEDAPNPSLLIGPQTQHAANWLVDHILTERLLARGFTVTLDSTAVEPGSLQLTYRILDLGITGQARLRGGQVDRRSRVTLAFSLSQEATLHWQDEVTKVSQDRVPKDRLDLLQNPSYSFAEIDLEVQSWSEFVEPIIVSTVLGGLIYLFFSNR